MRHSHAGLSIPDFPTTYGGWLPPLDPAAIVQINEARGAAGQPFISGGLILLQYVHRVWALLIAIGVVRTSVKLIRSTRLVRRQKTLVHCEIELCELPGGECYLVNVRQGHDGEDWRESTRTPQPVSLQIAETLFAAMTVAGRPISSAARAGRRSLRSSPHRNSILMFLSSV